MNLKKYSKTKDDLILMYDRFPWRKLVLVDFTTIPKSLEPFLASPYLNVTERNCQQIFKIKKYFNVDKWAISHVL